MTAPRVVSLVPSATETLRAWGIDPVAVTRFCEQPDLASVGGTKDPDIDAITDLAPDVVVMCVEENRGEDAEAMRRAGLELFVFDIDTIDDVDPQLRALADRLHIEMPSSAAVGAPRGDTAIRAFIPIWRRPWMTLRGGTYGSSILRHIGIANVFAEAEDRYPEVTLEQAARQRPDIVLAPSEPYPFADRHRAELEVVAPVVLVDGKDLFWWGVRTPCAIERLRAELIATFDA